jgi:hypothetical protein
VATVSSLALGQPHLPVFWEAGSSGLRTIIEKVTKAPDKDKQLEKIKEKIKDKKFLVLIDDLDRANPELIPELLLSLRDVLDIPSFAFVLAFDYRVVSSAISNRNQAWGDGRLFLEKIIDFPVSLSVPTHEQSKAFVEHWHKKLQIPIAISVLQSILEHLPNNPRKIKLFIRQLAASRDKLCRLGPDDLDERLVCLWMLMRIDYPDFCRRFVEEDSSFEMMQGLKLASLREEESAAQLEKRTEIENAVFGVCDLAGLSDNKNVVMARLENVAGVADAWNKADFLLAMRFLDAPTFLTKLELEKHTNKEQVEDIFSSLDLHAKDLGFTKEDVYQRFYELLVEAYDNILSRASNRDVDDDQLNHIDAAEKVFYLIFASLEFKEQLVTPPNFRTLFRVALGWAHFDGNKQDRVLRIKEKEKILSLLELVATEIVTTHDDILRWIFDAGHSQKEARKFAKAVATRIDQAIADDLFQRFSIDGGVEVSFDQSKLKRHKVLLFDLDSIFWGKYREKVLELLKFDNPIVIENAFQILRLIRYSNTQLIGIPNEVGLMTKFKADKELPLALWNLASSRPLQFRAVTDFEEARGILERGNNDIEFKKPEWMKVHLERLDNSLEKEGSVSWSKQELQGDKNS